MDSRTADKLTVSSCPSAQFQREALIPVAAGGFSYEDAARISGIPMGTAKSRVARARALLVNILDGDTPLPRDTSVRMTGASEDILAQLRALTSVGAASTAFA